MDLIGYSAGIKELINGKPGSNAIALVNELPLGRTQKIFGFVLGNKNIHVISPTKDVLQTLFNIANKIVPQDYYDYSIRISEEGKVKTLAKKGHSTIPIKKIKEELLSNGTFQRIFYETIKTDDFEITNSEFEGTIIKCEDEALLRRMFQLLVGLFPFVETTKETKKVGIECNFEIENYQAFKKEQKRKGTIICNITLDGVQVGSKSNSFIF